MEIKFNMNDIVYAALTERGKEILMNHIGPQKSGSIIPYFVDDNLIKIHLWELMQIFGPYSNHGSSQAIINVIVHGFRIQESTRIVKGS